MNILFKHIYLIKLNVLALILVLGILSAYGQDSLLVNGIIVDGSNRPLDNISISVENASELPVITNSEGEFTLKAESGNVWLNIVASGGFKNKRIYLDGRTRIKVFLSADDLDAGSDIINVLDQEHISRNFVSSFNAVDVEEINETPFLSPDQYLQGKISGVHVINHSGHPAGGALVLMRGVNSLNANNEPLYVVDGIPVVNKGVFGSVIDGFEYNPLLGVNPLDISSITVFKDQSLSAAYGSKASNGLVLIETLDPGSIETTIDLDLRYGYSLSPSNLIPQMDANQHKTLISEILFSSGLEHEFVVERYPQLYVTPGDDDYVRYHHNTNWQELIYSDAAFTNLNINVKGGDELAKYGLSFGYVDGEGIIKNTALSGYSTRFKGLLNIFSWLKMNSAISMNYNNSSLKESARVDETSPVLSSLAKSPLQNPFQFDKDGNELAIIADVDELGVSNPLAIIENNEVENDNFISTVALGFSAALKKNMQMKTSIGVNYSLLKEHMFMPDKGMVSYYNDEAINVAKVSNNSLFTIFNNTAFCYEQNFEQHKITSATGVNLQHNGFQYDWALTKNAPENDEYRMLQDGNSILRDLGGQNRTWSWISLYEYFTYSYKDKYLVMSSLSLDGTSRIGKNAENTLKIGSIPYGLFYSAGVGWRISNEAFLRYVSEIEELKIRLTYGHTGNDDVGESNARRFYSAVKYRETVGLVPATILNEKLTYETVNQINVGIDLALWGNRFRTSIDAYNSRTDNLLVYIPLKAYMGYAYQPQNAGSMSNNGVEFNFLGRAINMHNFKWDIQVSYSMIRNSIIDIKGDTLITPIEGGETANIVGEQANSFYGYIFKGVYSTAAEAKSRGLVNNKYIPYEAGDAIFKDLNGDSVINEFDKTIIGSSVPRHWGGINSTLKYKRWELNAFVQFVLGNEIYNYVRYKNERMTGIENQSAKVLQRWQYEGQETTVPKAIYDDYIGNSDFSTRWLEDGSYLRLKKLTLSYTIPGEFMVFKDAKFYFSATNLFTWTKYLGYDPEFSYSSVHKLQGIDYGLTPIPRQFIAGIKLGL